MKPHKESVTFSAGEIRLEGFLARVLGARNAPGVVICHPHPRMGGSMDNNVVQGLFDEFVSRGYVALAFNFRGTGRSGGTHEGGEGEILDVLSALQYLKALPETGEDKLTLVGYSFGAWIAIQAGMQAGRRVRCAGAVSPPVAMLPFDFLGRHKGPLFFVWGTHDPFCPAEQALQLLGKLTCPTGRKILAGTDHFLVGRERQAAAYLCDRFASVLDPAVPRPHD